MSALPDKNSPCVNTKCGGLLAPTTTVCPFCNSYQLRRRKIETPFWVLECKEVTLYFGSKCGKGSYYCALEDAIKFATKEDAEKAQVILKSLGVVLNHEPKEHVYAV